MRFGKIFWVGLKIVAVAIVLLGILIALELPDARRFKRYCEYPSKDALLAAEAQNVVSCEEYSINGSNITFVSMGPLGFLPSGSAILVYGPDGKLLDRTRDEGEDRRFQQKWSTAWRDAARALTCQWLRETQLLEPSIFAPATMADFVAYMEQASKDYDRPDKPQEKRGIRFRCGNRSAKLVFPEKPRSELPIIEVLSGKSVSFWDALTNACARTGCAYRVSAREVFIWKEE